MNAPPLSALLSQTLVAFTIEFDNEFEHRMPHTTTRHGATPGATHRPWLVSMAMWVHCMRHVPEQGIPAIDLARRAGLSARGAEAILKGMSRWGYVRVRPDAAGDRAKSTRAAWLVRPTAAGREAQRIWEPLTGEITERWGARYGPGSVDGLRAALSALHDRLQEALPDFLPIGDHARGWRSVPSRTPPAVRSSERDVPLSALLSRILFAYACRFDAVAELSLPLSANVLRVLTDEGVPVSRLPALTGIDRMGVDNSLSVLGRRGQVTVETDPGGGRARVTRPTTSGRAARAAYPEHTERIERDWERRFGTNTIDALRRALEVLAGGGTATNSPLFEALEPYPDGWRAQVPARETLPHYPMVSHRGGFPDGS